MDKYRRMKRVVKRMVREAKRRVNKEWTISIPENFKENKKKFGRAYARSERGRV